MKFFWNTYWLDIIFTTLSLLLEMVCVALQGIFVDFQILAEWDSKYSGGVNWRQKIDTQKGAVLATELKNNSCKLARWTAQVRFTHYLTDSINWIQIFLLMSYEMKW